MLRVAIPNKGRLGTRSLDLLRKAGIKVHLSHERQLYAATDHDLSLFFTRASDIPGFVADGVVDVGITGHDVVAEDGRPCTEVADLGFGRCRLVVAVPEDSAARAPEDLPEGARVATSFPRLARQHFESMGTGIRVIRVSGATELTPHIGVADAIVDLVSSGSTLAMNNLVEIGQVLTSSARLIAHPEVAAGRADDVARFARLLDSVLLAEGRRYVMANVPEDRLAEAKALLPGIDAPTVLDLAAPRLKALHAVVPEHEVNATIDGLKDLGAHGILVLPIERLVP